MPLTEDERLKIQKHLDNLADQVYDLITSRSRSILEPEAEEEDEVQKFGVPVVAPDEEDEDE